MVGVASLTVFSLLSVYSPLFSRSLSSTRSSLALVREICSLLLFFHHRLLVFPLACPYILPAAIACPFSSSGGIWAAMSGGRI